MKKIYFTFFFSFMVNIFLQAQIFTNLDFETGTISGWNIGRDWDYSINTPCTGMSMTLPSSNYNIVTHTSTIGSQCTNGIDNYGGFPVVAPDGGNYSLLLNNDSAGSKVMVANTGTFVLTPNNSSLTFRFAAVLQDSGHSDSTKPYFFIWVRGYGSSGGFLAEFYDTNTSLPVWQTSSIDSSVHYLPWTTVTLDISAYISFGYTCYASVYVNDCNDSAHFGYAYIDAASNLYKLTANPICIPGDSTTVYGPPGMASYNWTGPDSCASQNIRTSLSGQYTLKTTSFFDWPPASDLITNLTIDTVKGHFTVNAICLGDSTYFADKSEGFPNSWQWDLGDGSPLLNTQNPSHIYSNPGTYTATLVIGNICGVLDTIKNTVIVYSLPLISVSSQTACIGQPIELCDTIAGYANYTWDAPPFTGGYSCNTPCHTFPSAMNWMQGVWTMTVSDTNNCTSIAMCSVTLTPNDSCSLVWPGDANNDLSADGNDIINIGIGNGTSGITRANASINWIGQPCPFWTSAVWNNYYYFINNRHTDCDGNGIIDLNDTLAVIQNFGLTHPAHRPANGNVITNNLSLTLVPQQNNVASGNIGVFDIILGDNINAVSSAYGIVFNLQFDTTYIDANSLRINGNGSWMGTINTNLMAITLKGKTESEFAITRTDQNNVSGQGKIGEISFKTLNNINTTPSTAFSINYVNLVNYNITNIPVDLTTATATITITSGIGVDQLTKDNNLLSIYPNPAKDKIYIKTIYKEEMALLYDVYGNKVKSGKTEINISDLTEGVYFVSIKTPDGIVTKKIIVQR